MRSVGARPSCLPASLLRSGPLPTQPLSCLAVDLHLLPISRRRVWRRVLRRCGEPVAVLPSCRPPASRIPAIRLSMLPALIALLLLGTPAFAQSTQLDVRQIDDVRQNATFRIGPLYATPRLELREIGFDSNVFNQPVDPIGDFTWTLVSGARLALPIRRRALVVGNVSADLVYYQQMASQRSVDPSTSLRVTGFLRRATLFAEGSYVSTSQRQNQEIDARAQRTEIAGQAGIDVRLTRTLAAGVFGRSARHEYAEAEFFRDVSLRQALAVDVRNVGATVNYALTPKTTLGGRVEFQRDSFPFTPLKDSRSARVVTTVEFNPRALVSGSASVGFRQVRFLNDLLPDYRVLVGAAALRYSLRSTTTFTLTLDRDLQYSYLETEPYFISNGIGASIRRQLFGSFDSTLGAQWFRYRYADSLLSRPPAAQPRVDVTHNYSADIGYRVGRSRIGVGLSYWTRDSNRVTEFAYSGLRVGASIIYGF